METLNDNNVAELVRQAEQDWITGGIQTSKYVTQDFYEDINKIEAYLNSKHITGEKDSLGRDKPFFNIVLAGRNIWYRATDVDRKNIRAKANKAKDLLSEYLYTIHLQKWMNDANFGRFLNDWGLYLASYNSAICKFVEKNGELIPMVMDWNKMIVDVIDFDSNPKIEVLELTPAQLRRREGYDKDVVDKLINAVTSRKTTSGQQKDNKDNFIRLYEVHGELPLSYLTGREEDQDEYVQQMHVISFVATKEKGKYDDYCLISGREKQDPYMLTYLIGSIDGSISLMGSVKTLFESQWMVNHSMKAIKDHLDLASKLIFNTTDPNFTGRNVLYQIETGDILVSNKDIPNSQITQVNNSSHDITQLQNFGVAWKNLSQELISTPDILGGNTFPSGTAYRQAAIVQQEAHSNFEIMIENKGLFIEEMFRRYITPFLLKKMDTTDEVVATLGDYGIDRIDEMYIANEAVRRFNRKAVQAVLDRKELPTIESETEGIRKELEQLGGKRFIKPSELDSKTWKDVIGKFEGDIVYEITNENTEKQATLDTLSSVLQTIAGNPMILQDPNAKFLFNKILSETKVVSPLEIKETESRPVSPMVAGSATGNNQPMIQ